MNKHFLGFNHLFLQVLVNRYKETKIMSENEEKIIAVLQEAKDIAIETKELVEESTSFESDIVSLLKRRSEDIAWIDLVKVDKLAVELNPPCLPLIFRFKINSPGQVVHDGTSFRDAHVVCFNGEFYKNVAVRMLRIAFEKIDRMYSTLEEAELRYAKISGI